MLFSINVSKCKQILVDISKDKLRHQNARAYPLRKQFFIDRVMEKAEQKTLSEDSYHIMCEMESFIKEMVAIIKTRRSDTVNQEKKDGRSKKKTTC